jgi:hypothetical protein
MKYRFVAAAVTSAWMTVATCASAQGPAPEVMRDTVAPDVRERSECSSSFSVFHPVPASCLKAIETDRPHKTDTPGVLEPGHAQIELGVVEYEIEKIVGQSDNSLVMMNNIYKLGIVNRVDVEALYAPGSYAIRAKRFLLNSQMMFRAKVNILGEGSPLHVTLVPAVMAPITRRGTPEAGGYVFVGGELPAHIEFELNVGGLSETDPDTSRRHLAPVITMAFTRHIAGSLSGFVEWYNDTTSTDLRKWNATFDTGLLYLLSKDIQVDGGAYIGLYGQVPAITPFLGLSARL